MRGAGRGAGDRLLGDEDPSSRGFRRRAGHVGSGDPVVTYSCYIILLVVIVIIGGFLANRESAVQQKSNVMRPRKDVVKTFPKTALALCLLTLTHHTALVYPQSRLEKIISGTAVCGVLSCYLNSYYGTRVWLNDTKKIPGNSFDRCLLFVKWPRYLEGTEGIIDALLEGSFSSFQATSLVALILCLLVFFFL